MFEEVTKNPNKHVFIRVFDKMLQRHDNPYKNMRAWFNLSK